MRQVRPSPGWTVLSDVIHANSRVAVALQTPIRGGLKRRATPVSVLHRDGLATAERYGGVEQCSPML